MHGILLSVVVLVAVFAAAFGGDGKHGGKFKVFKECGDKNGLTWEIMKEKRENNEKVCDDPRTVGWSECVLTEFQVWNGDVLNEDFIKEKFVEGYEGEKDKLIECIHKAQAETVNPKPCTLMDCCKENNIKGKWGKRHQ